jgi:hypothetical protein
VGVRQSARGRDLGASIAIYGRFFPQYFRASTPDTYSSSRDPIARVRPGQVLGGGGSSGNRKPQPRDCNQARKRH